MPFDDDRDDPETEEEVGPITGIDPDEDEEEDEEDEMDGFHDDEKDPFAPLDDDEEA